MPTSNDKKKYYRKLYSHLEDQLVIPTDLRDKHGMPLYAMLCPICLQSRGNLRSQAKLLPCKRCGQKGKPGNKGYKFDNAFKKKISESNARRSPIGRNLTVEEKRIIHNLRSRLCAILKGKSIKTRTLIGCSLEDLKKHLESKFQQGMSWDNYGRSGWHIDHIKPLSKFDLRDPEQLKVACHYTNLQPLWALDNIKKSNN